MTEEEWTTSTRSRQMLPYLKGKVSDRKLRLFACAGCRLIWHLIVEPEDRCAVELAEARADELAADAVPPREANRPLLVSRKFAGDAVRWVNHPDVWHAAASTSGFLVGAWAWEAKERCGETGFVEFAAAAGKMYERTAKLLRHIVGNPFVPHRPLLHVPAAVRALADAAYQQNQTAVGPLHDALLDAGRTELADHFTDPAERHPKGCWAIDSLTGRT